MPTHDHIILINYVKLNKKKNILELLSTPHFKMYIIYNLHIIYNLNQN